MARTPSPGNPVEFFIDNQQNSKRSVSPGSVINDIIEKPEQEKVKQKTNIFLIISIHISFY
jgi:hypothetical protein